MEENFTYNSAWEDGYHYAQKEMKLKWTDKKPTEPGFYWCKLTNETEIVFVSEWHAEELDKNLLVVEFIGNDEKIILDEISSSEILWLGPLNEPGR